MTSDLPLFLEETPLQEVHLAFRKQMPAFCLLYFKEELASLPFLYTTSQ